MNDLRYAHVLSFCIEHPWAITKPMLSTIAAILGHRAAGLAAAPEDIQAAIASRKALPAPTRGSVAIIPIYGVITPRANLMSEMSGGCSYDALTAQLRAAVDDGAIASIVLDVDSPGGSVAGATEFHREVLRARTIKHVAAQANFTMASAGYWCASGASEIIASPSASVGSIGVLSMHDDLSEAFAKEGVRRTFITSAKYKAEGNPTEPLNDEARAHRQASVDEADERFVGDIAKGRGVSVSAVRSGYGQGRMFSAREAKTLGMIDRIATLDETLSRLLASPPKNDAGRVASRTTIDDGDGPTFTPLSPRATGQEPSPATPQEHAADIAAQLDYEFALMSLGK